MKQIPPSTVTFAGVVAAVCSAAVITFFALYPTDSHADKTATNVKVISLFNGKDLQGWTNRDGKAPGPGWKVENGELCLKAKKAGDIWTKARYGDFELRLEFKTTGNSGVFIRTDKPKDNVQTGIEIQVDTPKGPNRHSVGALYDLVAPTKNVGIKGAWNSMTVVCQGSRIKVTLNGEPVSAMDVDQWTTARQNPDGSKNKFRTAVKDFKREGHIGLQDHGATVCYRNIVLTPLATAK